MGAVVHESLPPRHRPPQAPHAEPQDTPPPAHVFGPMVVGVVGQGCRQRARPDRQVLVVPLQTLAWSATHRVPGVEAQSASVWQETFGDEDRAQRRLQFSLHRTVQPHPSADEPQL